MTSRTEAGRTRTGVSRPGAGFTLIEMMVVLAVLGLALGLIVARGPMRSVTVDTGAAAGTVAQALRVARAQAIEEGRPTAVAIDPARHILRIAERPVQALPGAITLAVRNAAGEALPGAQIATIAFAPDGSATGGAVELAAGGRHATVTVDWLTGRVRVDATK